jgi:DNA invertase Pin-like site-specific DNA recombinase
MSTDHQQYSIANQSAAIALYAAAHNIGIVRSFIDEGRSGTTVNGRRGLQELLCTVQSGVPDFELILVYDVSRWGRFPDSDEAAHHEFLCKKAGIAVRYCAEQFENDNSPTSNLLKSLKRMMAGEYSRELGVKVFAGQCRIASLGWWNGGRAPFGFVRRLVDKDGRRKQVLKRGERKSIATDRVTLCRGSRKAVATIKLVYDLFTNERKNFSEIKNYLNARGLFLNGGAWTGVRVRCVLINPVYKGDYVFGLRSKGTTKIHTKNPPRKLIVCEGAFPRIVAPEQFARAQDLIAERANRRTKPEMLKALQNLWKRKGTLSYRIVDAANGVPSSTSFIRRFGSLSAAYGLIGFPHRDCSYAAARRSAKGILEKLCEEICYRIRAVGATAARGSGLGSLVINGNLSAKVVMTFGHTSPEGQTIWRLPIHLGPRVDILIIARLDLAQQSILDYYVVPALAELRGNFHVKEGRDAPLLDLYRMKNLDPLVETLRSRPILEIT